MTMNDTFVTSLGDISSELNRSLATFIFIFGTIGNILNCLILSQSILRLNPCGFLFLTSSIANLISILVGLPTRILAGWHMDPTDTNSWICKCRAYFVFAFRTIGFWLIVLATIDRWLSSSIHANYRRFSTLKNAKIGCAIIVLVANCLYLQMFYCYEANLINTPLKCYAKTDACRLVTDLFYVSMTIVVPLILMFLFGLLTILNIRHSHRRVKTSNRSAVISVVLNGQTRTSQKIKQHQKKIDHHLVVMLLFEVIIAAILTLPQAIEKLISTLTDHSNESDYQQALYAFTYNLFLLLSFLESGMPFYIYTLAGGKIYRDALKNITKKLLKCEQ